MCRKQVILRFPYFLTSDTFKKIGFLALPFRSLKQKGKFPVTIQKQKHQGFAQRFPKSRPWKGPSTVFTWSFYFHKCVTVR